MTWHAHRLQHRLDREFQSSDTPKSRPDARRRAIEFYLDGRSGHPNPMSARSVAYLRGYVELGGVAFPSDGLPCSDQQFIWPDKAVMRALYQGEYVKFDNAKFILTDRGRELIWG